MTASGVLHSVAKALREAGIPYMLTGSFAAAAHGVPRATLDINLVIDPTAAQLRSYVAAVLASGRYVSAEAAEEARAHETLFNVIEPVSGWKIDHIIRKARPFSRVEFERRRELDFDGVQLPVASAEDVMLSKLEWARLGGSSRQLEDVAALLRVREADLDFGYLRQWVAELGIGAEWSAVCRMTGRDEDHA